MQSVSSEQARFVSDMDCKGAELPQNAFELKKTIEPGKVLQENHAEASDQTTSSVFPACEAKWRDARA